MKSSKVLIMDNESEEILKEVVFCNSLPAKQNLVNCVTFYSHSIVVSKEKEKEIENQIKSLKYGYIYNDDKFKYWIRK